MKQWRGNRIGNTSPQISSKEVQIFLDFVRRENLSMVIHSLTIVMLNTDSLLKHDRIDETHVCGMFWEDIFAVVNPTDVVVVASPQGLGAATSCFVDTTDAWNFSMPYQLLALSRTATPPRPATRYSADGCVPEGKLSLFELQPWTKLLLNEGNFIRAYTSFEYALKTAPSILPELIGTPHTFGVPALSPTIRDFSYIAVFPFGTHFSNLTRNLPRINRLFVQLTPRDDILSDKKTMAQVEPMDLWMEQNRCDASLMGKLFTRHPSNNYRYIREFESGDAEHEASWKMASEYVRRSRTGWNVGRKGTFMREIKSDAVEEGNRDADGPAESAPAAFATPI
jgi:hypothetical protein